MLVLSSLEAAAGSDARPITDRRETETNAAATNSATTGSSLGESRAPLPPINPAERPNPSQPSNTKKPAKRPRGRSRKQGSGESRTESGAANDDAGHREETPSAQADAAPRAPDVWAAMVGHFADQSAFLPAAFSTPNPRAPSRVYCGTEMELAREQEKKRSTIVRGLRYCAGAQIKERRRWTLHAVAAQCGVSWTSLERIALRDEEIATLLAAVGPRATSVDSTLIDFADVRRMILAGCSVATVARNYGMTKEELKALAGPNPALADALGLVAAPPTPKRKTRTANFNVEGLRALREMKALGWSAARQAALFGSLSVSELRGGCRNVSVLRNLDMPLDFDLGDLRRQDPQHIAECARSMPADASLHSFCYAIGRSPEALLVMCGRFATLRLALARTPIAKCPPVAALLQANGTLSAATFDLPPPQPQGQAQAQGHAPPEGQLQNQPQGSAQHAKGA